jgi:hypothetical protein
MWCVCMGLIFFISYPLIFSLLNTCTIEQWLVYRSWYAYHRLINPAVVVLIPEYRHKVDRADCRKLSVLLERLAIGYNVSLRSLFKE